MDNHEVFCGELGEYIQHVRFSDNRSRSDDHMPLGVFIFFMQPWGKDTIRYQSCDIRYCGINGYRLGTSL